MDALEVPAAAGGARDLILLAVLPVAVLLAPWLARAAVRLASRAPTSRAPTCRAATSRPPTCRAPTPREAAARAPGSGGPAARPSVVRVVVTGLLLATLLGGAVLLTGVRPATVALAWAGGAAVVLASVDLLAHRLPDRVTGPAVAVCVVAFAVDAAVLGSEGALLRALVAAAAAFAVAAAAAAVSREGLGFGDVKLLGLLGLVLGWAGWGVLLAGVFLGLLIGAVVSVALLAAGRVGWRTALPFGPPLLAGGVLALGLDGMAPLG